MTILKNAVGVMIGQHLYLQDAVEYEGEIWIVLEWFGNQERRLRRPEKVIPLNLVKHQVMPDTVLEYRYFVNDPIPKSLIDGTADESTIEQYQCQSLPDAVYPLASTGH